MAKEDKLMGRRDKNKIYASYRVDFNSKQNPRENLDLSDAVKVPPKNYEGHEAKTGYKRKAICETSAVKDKVVQWCKDNNVSYTIEQIDVTQEEKDAFKSYKAENGLQANEASKWLQAAKDLDKNNISRKAFELGNNPHQGENFKPPKGRGRN